MFKEEGYDAFLAERIKAGQEALARGEIVSREQALIEIRQAILEEEKYTHHAYTHTQGQQAVNFKDIFTNQ